METWIIVVIAWCSGLGVFILLTILSRLYGGVGKKLEGGDGDEDGGGVEVDTAHISNDMGGDDYGGGGDGYDLGNVGDNGGGTYHNSGGFGFGCDFGNSGGGGCDFGGGGGGGGGDGGGSDFGGGIACRCLPTLHDRTSLWPSHEACSQFLSTVQSTADSFCA